MPKLRDVQPEGEERQEEGQAEESQEEELTLEAIQAKLSETNERLEKVATEKSEYETRNRDLSKRLTKSQQEAAEWNRYFKHHHMPENNKSFEDTWADDPEKAVDQRIAVQTGRDKTKLDQAGARSYLALKVAESDELKKYIPRFKELGVEYPDRTWNEDGIDWLLDKARLEYLEKENEKLKSDGQAEMEKSRAITEPTTRFSKGGSKTPKLSEAQLKVVSNLGIKPEEYLERMK